MHACFRVPGLSNELIPGTHAQRPVRRHRHDATNIEMAADNKHYFRKGQL